MNDMLGNRLLPETVNEQRRKVRSRLRSLRRPIQERREQAVPGPDVIGGTEERLNSIKQRLSDGVAPTDRLPTPGQGDTSDTDTDTGSDSSSGDEETTQPIT